MRILQTIALVFLLFAWGCSSEDAPGNGGGPMNLNEIISAPNAATGTNTLALNDSATYTTGGAFSSLNHPVEYRFDFDATGMNDFTDWSASETVGKRWTRAGSFVVRVEARCSIHNDKVSLFSDPSQVIVDLVPMTRFVKLESRYLQGGNWVTEQVNITDSNPDTLPYKSWLTIFYEGTDEGYDPGLCADPLNKCFRYQFKYERSSPVGPQFTADIPWTPFNGPVDNNPLGTQDSITMNVSALDYLLYARTEALGAIDAMPPTLPIRGNLPPRLTGQSLVNYDGTVISPGDTITFDWWNPADSSFTPTMPVLKRKEFWFAIKATGLDHPKENDVSGVKSWRYTFNRVSDSQSITFGTPGFYRDAPVVNTLCDTFRYVVDLDVLDVVGDEIFVNNPPPWQNEDVDYAITGKDMTVFETFSQRLYTEGEIVEQNSYGVGLLALETQSGTLRFHIRLVR